MNAALEIRVFLPACTLVVALSGSAAVPAWAEVYKCRNSDGATVYQEAPCTNTGSAGNKLDLKDPTGGAKSGDKAKSADRNRSPDREGKAMNEAFQRRMDKKDYEGAQAFATDDKQKAQARKLAAEKNAKCASLSIRAQKTQADFRAQGARAKAAADAAEAEYALHCR